MQRFVPEVAINYRNGMRKVDTHDQLLSLFSIGRISKKWWHPIFYNLLECAIINSWVLFKVHKKYNITQKEFRLNLAKQLVGEFSSRERDRLPARKKRRGDSTEIHYPDLTTHKHKCRCSKECQSKTKYSCSFCKIPLLPEHFEIAHKEMD